MSDKPSIVLVHGFWGGAAHWAKVIVELKRRGYDSLHAVENPLTSLADDVGRTRTMVEQVDGPVLLVGHSYGGAVITEAGDLPNVIGLVYVAAFAPDAGESLAQIGDWLPAEAAVAGNVEPDSDGYVWIKQDKFRESFCQDLSADEALVMAVTQKAPLGSTFGDTVSEPAWKTEADLVPGLDERPHDPPGHRASDGRADEPTAHDRARRQPRLAGLAARRNRGSDRPSCRRSQRDHRRSSNNRWPMTTSGYESKLTDVLTPASVWQGVAGEPIHDGVLEWPPDLFALTDVILERAEAYRFALSPPAGEDWPPRLGVRWCLGVAEAARRWSAWAEDGAGSFPELVGESGRWFGTARTHRSSTSGRGGTGACARRS